MGAEHQSESGAAPLPADRTRSMRLSSVPWVTALAVLLGSAAPARSWAQSLSGTSGGAAELWGSRTLLDLKLAQLGCATDPACLDGFQGAIDFHPVNGAPRVRIDLSTGTSVMPILDWAASHPSAVSLEERTVTEGGTSATRLVVAIAGPDPQALWPGLVAAAASLDVGGVALWTPEPAPTAGLHPDLSTLSSAFGACQGDAACASGLESGRPWFDAGTSAAAVSLSVRAAADASNVSAIQSWLSGLSWAGAPRVQVVQAPTLTRVVASGPLSASALGGLPQEAFLSGKEWHTRPLRDEERTDSWLRLDVVGASVGVERCGGPPPCEDGSDLPVPAVLDASGRVLVRVAPRTGGSTALEAFAAAGWSELGSLADASGTVHVVGWADAVALLEIGRGHAVPGGLTVTLGVAEDLASLGLGSGPDDLSFLMDGPVAFWGSATLLEMIGAERQCAEDPGCLSYYQGRVAFDPVTGAPQLRLALPAGEDAGIVDAWATRHPDRVRILERWVLADALTFIEWTVSVAGEDDGGVWMELLSDLSTGLSAGTDVGITPEPLRAPGLHGDVIGLLDPVGACAGDPACIEPLAVGRAWFDPTDMTAALELAVAADPSGADAAALAQEVAALGWTGGATIRTVDTPLGVRVEALGRLPLSLLESLGQEPALSGRPWSTRPQRDEEVTGARLSIAALVTADQVRACLDEPACVPGQDFPLPAVVEPDGRILARLEPASGSAQALLEYATPGWTGLADESTSTDLVVVGWVTWDGVAHFGKGVPVIDEVVPAGLDVLLAHLDDLPVTGDDDVASDDDVDPPPDDDDGGIGDDDVSIGDDDVTVGDDDVTVPDPPEDPTVTFVYAAGAYTVLEGPRPGDCPSTVDGTPDGPVLPTRHAWWETTFSYSDSADAPAEETGDDDSTPSGDDDTTLSEDDDTASDDDTTPPGDDDAAGDDDTTGTESTACSDFETLGPNTAPDGYFDPDETNGDPLDLDSADGHSYPAELDRPTRSVLEDYYVCRLYREEGAPLALDTPDWCPPTGTDNDWFTLARGPIIIGGEYYDMFTREKTLTVGPSVGQSAARSRVVLLDDNLSALASVRKITATTTESPWHAYVTYRLTLTLRLTAPFAVSTEFFDFDEDLLFAGISTVDPVGTTLRIPVDVQVTTTPDPDGNASNLDSAFKVLATVDADSASWSSPGSVRLSVMTAYAAPGYDVCTAELANAIRTMAAEMVATLLADESDAFAAALESFLGPYVFAVNDVFGCPGVLSPCDVPYHGFIEDAPGSYWQAASSTHPQVRAQLPAQVTLNALDDAVLGDDCHRGDAWEDVAGAVYLLTVQSEDEIGIRPEMAGTSLGELGEYKLTTGGAATTLEEVLGGIVAQYADPTDPSSALYDQERLELLMLYMVNNLVAMQSGHPGGSSCDDRFNDLFGGPGAEIQRCLDDCGHIATGTYSLKGQVDAGAGAARHMLGCFGDPLDSDPLWCSDSSLLAFVEDACEAECASVEARLRDRWIHLCRDSNTLGADPPGGAAGDAVDPCTRDDYDSDGDGLPNDEEYVLAEDGPGGAAGTPVKGPFGWTLDESGIVVLYQATCSGDEVVFDPATSQEVEGVDADPDQDGFPNHLDPVSGVGGSDVLDGPRAQGAVDDSFARFAFARGMSPTEVLGIEILSGMCLRGYIDHANIRGPGDAPQPVVEPGSEPEIDLVLAAGGDGGNDLHQFVPAILVRERFYYVAAVDIFLPLDQEILEGAEDGETCDGTDVDEPPFDGVTEKNFSLYGLELTVPIEIGWPLPLADDRFWEWGGAFVDANVLPLDMPAWLGGVVGPNGPGSSHTPTNVRPSARVNVAIRPGTLQLSTPMDPYVDVHCNYAYGFQALPYPIPSNVCGDPEFPEGVEFICYAGYDDDGDDLVDCEDPDCSGAPDCWIDVRDEHGESLNDEPGLAAIKYALAEALGQPMNRTQENSLDEVGEVIRSKLDGVLPISGGSLFAGDLPHLDPDGFWYEVENHSGIAGLTGLTPYDVMLPLSRAAASFSGSDPLAMLSSLAPDLRLLLAQDWMLDGDPSTVAGFDEADALWALLSSFNPRYTFSAIREDVFLALFTDAADGLTVDHGAGFTPETVLYGGWTLSTPMVYDDYNPAISAFDDPEWPWEGSVALRFYRLAYPYIGAPGTGLGGARDWRVQNLPRVTPGGSGE